MAITLNIDIENDIFYKKGIEKGIEKGVEKGEDKKSKQVAINLIKKGFDNDFIADVTKLSIVEIEKIRKELGK